MDKYTFLIFSLPYFFVYLIIFIFRKDLRYKLIVTGLVGGIAPLITEPTFLNDYWKPPTILGIGKVSIEDIILGASIIGMSSTCCETILKKKLVKKFNTKLILSLSYYLAGLFIFFYFNKEFDINSIFTCSFGFLFFTIFVLLSRKDLIVPSILSSLFITIYTIIVYLALSIYSPLFWQKYWLLYNSPLKMMIFGRIPWTEILWYLSLGLIVGSYYEFTLGLQREKIEKNEEIASINPFKLIASELKKNL